MSIIALYPGSFDPLTFGHTDIIERACKIGDRLVIGVAENNNKSPLFSLEERLEILRAHISTLPPSKTPPSKTPPPQTSIEVLSFTGLLTDFAKGIGARYIVRGLRAVSDFEYEFQMASANRRLMPDLETVFLTASEQQHFVASSLVKEIARLGGDISSFVPADVASRLQARLHARLKKN